MAEFIIYTDQSVNADGYTVVSPEVIASLLNDVVLNDHQGEYVEGNFGLTVKYDDLKEFIQKAGHTVKEMKVNSLPRPTLMGVAPWGQENKTAAAEGEEN